jgi:hypothetical protein
MLLSVAFLLTGRAAMPPLIDTSPIKTEANRQPFSIKKATVLSHDKVAAW